jgi:hypothetical protein
MFEDYKQRKNEYEIDLHISHMRSDVGLSITGEPIEVDTYLYEGNPN